MTDRLKEYFDRLCSCKGVKKTEYQEFYSRASEIKLMVADRSRWFVQVELEEKILLILESYLSVENDSF